MVASFGNYLLSGEPERCKIQPCLREFKNKILALNKHYSSSTYVYNKLETNALAYYTLMLMKLKKFYNLGLTF
jgi:hypothetical protein